MSPIPGFKKWLDNNLEKEAVDLLCVHDYDFIKKQFHCENSLLKLKELLAQSWFEDHELSQVLKPVLLSLCARYLLVERDGERALDPVMNFHLTNGARVERINWMADMSDRGMMRSYGIMVNYYYDLSDIDSNHEQYISKTKIASTRDVKNLLRE